MVFPEQVYILSTKAKSLPQWVTTMYYRNSASLASGENPFDSVVTFQRSPKLDPEE